MFDVQFAVEFWIAESRDQRMKIEPHLLPRISVLQFVEHETNRGGIPGRSGLWAVRWGNALPIGTCPGEDLHQGIVQDTTVDARLDRQECFISSCN
jgi:hypothetical protein